MFIVYISKSLTCIVNHPRQETDNCIRLQNVRTRKCSIVQEEEDEDDVSSCSGRDEHGSNSALNSLNRRGSRSEGKLSHVLQERLSQLPEKHVVIPPIRQIQRQELKAKGSISPSHTFTVVKVQQDIPVINKEKLSNRLVTDSGSMTTALSNLTNRPIQGNSEEQPKSVTECISSPGLVPSNKWRLDSQQRQTETIASPSKNHKNFGLQQPETTILTESLTAPAPLRSSRAIGDVALPLKYKTLPTPCSEKQSTDKVTLNEILEDGDAVESTPERDITAKSRVVRRSGYEQKRSKFHKARTTSCSSSDASDDDSEGRKKRAHKLGAATGKPLPSRRDSHDDSSDSQDPGSSGGAGRGLGNGESVQETEPTSKRSNNNNNSNNQSGTSSTTNTTGGKVQRCTDSQTMNFGRRHRTGRRRTGETRLRESQSLNRITEVQEAEPPNVCSTYSRIVTQSAATTTTSIVVSRASTNVTSASQVSTTVQRAKGFGARLLQSWNLGGKTGTSTIDAKSSGHFNEGKAKNEKFVELVKDDKKRELNGSTILTCDKENSRASVNRHECKSRKIRLLTRYLAVHKRLCVPLPGFLTKGKLYKARSCGNISKERVSPSSPKSVLLCAANERRQWCDTKEQHCGSDGDINQNLGLAQFVQDRVVGNGCAGLPAICHIHLGDPSKCCSLC